MALTAAGAVVSRAAAGSVAPEGADRRVPESERGGSWMFEAIEFVIVQPGRAVFMIGLPTTEDVVNVILPLPPSDPNYPGRVRMEQFRGRTIAAVQEAVRSACRIADGLLDDSVYVVDLRVVSPGPGIEYTMDSEWLVRLLTRAPHDVAFVHSSQLRWLIGENDRVFAVRLMNA